MSGLILPAWMTRQPQYAAKLDTSNTLAKNPAFLYLPHYEAVRNAALSLLGTVPPVRTIGPAGFAHFFAGSTAGNSYLSLGTMPGAAVDISRSPCTFVGVFTASSKATVALAQRHDNNATDKGWSFGTTYGSEMGLMLEYGTSNFRKTITDSPTSGINVLVATHDGSQNASNCSVYLNGVLGTVSANGTGTGTSGTDAAQTLFIGQSQFPISVSHSGLIFMVGAFRRQWIATEVAAFSRNPWQIFKAPTRRLWIGASTGGGSTYNVDAADSITSTDGATQQLTAPATATDAASAADTASNALTIAASTTDAASATDSTTSASAVNSAATDAITATDTATQLAVLPAAASDAIAAADVASNIATMPAAATDAATATDSATGLRITTAAATDAATATDSASQVNAVNVAATDAISAADAATVQAVLAGIVSDGFSAIDAATLLAGIYNLTAADVLSLLDAALADGGVQYARAPQGAGQDLIYPGGHRPAVISGNRPGNINTARPANRGGRRT